MPELGYRVHRLISPLILGTAPPPAAPMTIMAQRFRDSRSRTPIRRARVAAPPTFIAIFAYPSISPEWSLPLVSNKFLLFEYISRCSRALFTHDRIDDGNAVELASSRISVCRRQRFKSDRRSSPRLLSASSRRPHDV